MVAAITHYNVPALSTVEKFRLFEALGLAGKEFCFAEMKGDRLLRAKRVGCLPWSSLLGDVPEELPRASLVHPRERWIEGRLGGSLWAQIFPPPLDLMPSYALEPAGFREEWGQLIRAFARAEQQLAETEVACLAVWSSAMAAPFVVFMHFVRRRCRLVGTSDRLTELAVRAAERCLTPADLQEWFGTQASYYSLDLRGRAEGVASLSAGLEELMRAPAMRVEFRLSGQLLSEIGL